MHRGSLWLTTTRPALRPPNNNLQAEIPVYNYSAPAFYGFRGEAPGTEGWRRADYGGLAAGLRCVRVTLRAGVAGPPGEQYPCGMANKHVIIWHGVAFACGRRCGRAWRGRQVRVKCVCGSVGTMILHALSYGSCGWGANGGPRSGGGKRVDAPRCVAMLYRTSFQTATTAKQGWVPSPTTTFVPSVPVNYMLLHLLPSPQPSSP